jgi:hypothetical protein
MVPWLCPKELLSLPSMFQFNIGNPLKRTYHNIQLLIITFQNLFALVFPLYFLCYNLYSISIITPKYFTIRLSKQNTIIV